MGHILMSHETHRCDIGVRALSQHQPKRNDSAGVAMYCGGVEGTDFFLLVKSPVYIGLFSVYAIRALFGLCK